LSDQINTGQSKGKKIGCGSIIIFFLLLAWISSLFNNGGDTEPTTPTKTTGSYCAILTKYINEAVTVMGGAGTTTTVADVTSVLLDRGTALATGFDVEMAGSVERYNLIRGAGQQLLQIRVALIDGGDVTKPANDFATSAAAIKATCQ
jgi:hypothetical protein